MYEVIYTDWLLIWQQYDMQLILVDTGMHSDLF